MDVVSEMISRQQHEDSQRVTSGDHPGSADDAGITHSSAGSLLVLLILTPSTHCILLTSSLAQQQAMAQSEETCYINKLPNELLAQILHLILSKTGSL